MFLGAEFVRTPVCCLFSAHSITRVRYFNSAVDSAMNSNIKPVELEAEPEYLDRSGFPTPVLSA